MSALEIVAIALIAAGNLGLVYGGITYTKTTPDAKIGSLELSIQDQETVNVPVWAGVGAIVVGGVPLFARRQVQLDVHPRLNLVMAPERAALRAAGRETRT